MKKFIIVILTIVALLPLHTISADWAYSFVVYSGDIYEISDDILIPSEEIGKKIGQVTRYSDHEETYSGNFSNTFPKGTAYYSIMNTDPKKAIAIKTGENIFVSATNKGHYANDGLEGNMIWLMIIGSLLIVSLIIWMVRRRNLKT